MNVKSNCLYLLGFLFLCSANPAASDSYSVKQKYSGITAVTIEGHYESVSVNVTRSPNVSLRFSGKIKQSIVGSELKLASGSTSSIDHVFLQAGSSGRSIVVINGVHISGSTSGGRTQWSSGSSRPVIELDVPVGTEMRLISFKGQASIGDIQAPFVLKGSGQVTVGDVTDAYATLGGNGILNMTSATGDLLVDLRGNSSMCIEGGRVTKTRINSSGNSHFTYYGWTDRLDVNSKGNSRVEVAGTGFRPRIRQRGNAEVIVNL